MPTYTLTKSWSAPIALADRDILQQQSIQGVEMVAGDPATDPTALRMPGYLAPYQVDRAVTIRARAVTGTAVLAVIKGF